jgi:ubiquinone/menaquinone biosynthesis C-methylase UbiE
MGFGAWYGRVVFPRLMEWALGSEACSAERRRVLAPAHGAVLEIGFGTGLNLAHYPPGVTSLTIIDPAELLPARVADRIAAAPFPVTRARLDAERLPFDDARFDSVVSTWTLCSIPAPLAALREIRRVLRADGTFLFLEHGRSEDASVARWQDRWNPIQRVVACGCNVNRPIDALIREAGLALRQLDRFVMPGEIQVMGSMYRGAAAPG